MNLWHYPVELAHDDETQTVVAVAPDVPQAHTFGETEEEVQRARAEDEVAVKA